MTVLSTTCPYKWISKFPNSSKIPLPNLTTVLLYDDPDESSNFTNGKWLLALSIPTNSLNFRDADSASNRYLETLPMNRVIIWYYYFERNIGNPLLIGTVWYVSCFLGSFGWSWHNEWNMINRNVIVIQLIL